MMGFSNGVWGPVSLVIEMRERKMNIGRYEWMRSRCKYDLN